MFLDSATTQTAAGPKRETSFTSFPVKENVGPLLKVLNFWRSLQHVNVANVESKGKGAGL